MAGCYRTEYSQPLTEPAEVYDVCFVPEGHGSGYAYGKNGGPVSVTIPANYAVVFKCQHGKFVIDGSRGETLYNKLSRGDYVTVTYSEVFAVTKEATNLTGLHFIDANRVKE